MIKLPEEEKARVMFKTNEDKLKRPYCVHADTECSLAPTGLADKTPKHVPNSACVYFVCDYDLSQSRLWYDIGPYCTVNMLAEITKLSDACIAKIEEQPGYEDVNRGHVELQNATHCSICSEPFNEKSSNKADKFYNFTHMQWYFLDHMDFWCRQGIYPY